MLTIRKACRFHAAHILTNHAGACRNLHGHTYRVIAEVAQAAGADADMVMDFHDLQTVLRETVVEPLDHAFLYDETSPSEREIAAAVARQGMKAVAFPWRTTAENLARHLFGALARRVNVTAVTVHETDDSCAEYRRERAEP